MRHFIKIVEGLTQQQQPLTEIEIGGHVDPDYFNDIKKTDYRSDQYALFKSLPTLEPKLPKEFTEVGRIGAFYVARKNDGATQGKHEEYTYVVLDAGVPIAYVAVISPNAPFGGGYRVANPPIDGRGLRVVSVMVDPSHRGSQISLKMYEWLLRNACDYILPDDLQTPGGVAIWRKLLNSRKFEVMVFDPERDVIRRRRPGKDFDQVYRSERLRPFVTLAGRADALITGDADQDGDDTD